MKSLNPAEEPADLAAVLPALRRYFGDAVPHMPPIGETRARFWTSQGYQTRGLTYGVFADDAAEDDPALALVNLEMDLDHNLDLVEAFVAAPRELLHGEAGRFALREALRISAEHGRSRLSVDGPTTVDLTGPVTGLGGKKVNTTTRSVLDLTEVDRARYAAWAEGSAENADYRLVRWVDHCPQELAESFSRATTAMDDAPLEDMAYEHAKPSVDRLRGHEEHSARWGVRRRVMAAVDPAGEVAGFNIFVTMPDEPETVDIWDTAVIRAHRGHGLGLRVKAAATLWMLEELPRARWVPTYNNHGNTHMLAVNRALGYRKSEDWYGFELATAR